MGFGVIFFIKAKANVTPKRSGGGPVKFVYLIKSKNFPTRFYVGSTNDIDRRLSEHNQSRSPYTRKFAPWELVCYFAFDNHSKAKSFESYLKTGSGRAFAKRHF